MTNSTPTKLDEIHEFKETLKRQLTNEWPYRRTPNGFQNTLNEARNASQHLTARIFHDIGLQAWLAYFLVNHRTTRHFQGQGALRKSIATLQELPIEEKKSIAYELTRVVPHDTIRKVLEQLLRAEKHPCDESEDLSGTNKRHADHVDGMLHISPATRSTTDRFSNEALNEIQMARETTSESTLYNRSESRHTIFEPVADQVPDGAAAGLSGQQTVSNPSADRLASVFPQYTCGAVRNSGGTASITMTFPAQLSGPKVECLMSLSILPNKIQYLAMELFGVHVESDTGLWYITLDNGVRVLPQYEVVLQGGKEKGIEKLLGSEPSLALKKSPLRKEEVRQGKLRTNCVTLRLASNCDFDGILNLNLGLDEAFRLKDALFK